MAQSILKIKKKSCRLKIPGGIRTICQMYEYVQLVYSILGTDWVKGENFRIDANFLCDQLIKDYNN